LKSSYTWLKDSIIVCTFGGVMNHSVARSVQPAGWWRFRRFVPILFVCETTSVFRLHAGGDRVNNR
jgi:hypothetical protein